jgi:ubiquinone biosynthesis protein
MAQSHRWCCGDPFGVENLTTATTNLFRLARAGYTLARHDALLPPEQVERLPWIARAVLKLAQVGKGDDTRSPVNRLTAALASLGPSYIKLGQFLSTRPDVIGVKRAFELKSLQDRLPPFGMAQAKDIIRAELGAPVETLFAFFGEPVAAASVAQVHKSRTTDGRDVAVKILRPDVDKRFAADISSFGFAARMIERVSREGRRLRPVAAVGMLEESMKLELDLRMEASAIAEMAKNTADDPGFRLPKVDWERTSRRVLTTEWLDATPIADIDGLRRAGHDLNHLGDLLIQSFLRHAIRDGFFHADMHQGNLMVDAAGNIVALDLGITGRINAKEQLFLAEILFGFITRNYKRIAEVHFEAGYVPDTQDVETFAQALRAIGEPIMDLPADKISMARLLTQLFEVTEQFQMVTQPRLLLLQKTMVVVEGVARTLNSNLNMWTTAEPVVRQWIERKLGPVGKIEQVADGTLKLGRAALQLPEMLDEAQKATRMLSDMANGGGLRLDDVTAQKIATQQLRARKWQSLAIYAGALALIAIAVKVVWG